MENNSAQEHALDAVISCTYSEKDELERIRFYGEKIEGPEDICMPFI